MAQHRTSIDRPNLLALLLWPIALVGLTILLHETGHLLAAKYFGLPDTALHFDRVDYDERVAVDAWKLGVIGLAGPAVTIILIIIGLAWAGKTRHPAAYALAAAAASRLIVGVPYTVVALALFLSGRHLAAPSFDEARAALAFGLPPEALMAVSTAAFFIAFGGVVGALPKGLRLLGLSALVAGTAAGWGLWMVVLGPRLLP